MSAVPYEITKDIIMLLIEKNALEYKDYPNAETYVDIVCEAYKQVFKTVLHPQD